METLFTCGFYDLSSLAEVLAIARRDHLPAGEIALTSFEPGAPSQAALVREGSAYRLVITTGKSAIGEHVHQTTQVGI